MPFDLPPNPPAHVQQAPSAKEGSVDQFLNLISYMESSGGQNTDHKPVGGIHNGEAAIGEYGLMPNTVREMAGRLQNRDSRLQLPPNFQGAPEIEKYSNPNITDDQLREELTADPRLQKDIAKHMARLLQTRSDNDLDKMAYGYNMGHNRDLAGLPSDKVDANPYVEKFRKLKQEQMTSPDSAKFNRLRDLYKQTYNQD